CFTYDERAQAPLDQRASEGPESPAAGVPRRYPGDARYAERAPSTSAVRDAGGTRRSEENDAGGPDRAARGGTGGRRGRQGAVRAGGEGGRAVHGTAGYVRAAARRTRRQGDVPLVSCPVDRGSSR